MTFFTPRAFLKGAIKWVRSKFFSAHDDSDNKRYAWQINSRVEKILNEHIEDGCAESDFIPYFSPEEMDLVRCSLIAMNKYGMVKKKVKFAKIRYFRI